MLDAVDRAIRTRELALASELVLYHRFHRFQIEGTELYLRPLYDAKVGIRATCEMIDAIGSDSARHKDQCLLSRIKTCKT